MFSHAFRLGRVAGKHFVPFRLSMILLERLFFFPRRRLNVLLAVTGFCHKNIFVGLQLIEVFKSIQAVIEHLMIGHGN